MKQILRLEEVALFGAAVFGLIYLNAAWWWYPLLILGPDISMLGYLAGNVSGAVCYNLFHHKGLAVVLFVSGLLIKEPLLQLTGITLFGHASMDRLFGYGLKTFEGFKLTHLGIIGKQ